MGHPDQYLAQAGCSLIVFLVGDAGAQVPFAGEEQDAGQSRVSGPGTVRT